jgi:hypothetical protein
MNIFNNMIVAPFKGRKEIEQAMVVELGRQFNAESVVRKFIKGHKGHVSNGGFRILIKKVNNEAWDLKNRGFTKMQLYIKL